MAWSKITPPTRFLLIDIVWQVFYGGGTDTGKTLELVGTYCNKVPFSYMEAPEKYRSVTVRLVVKGSYNMSLVNSPVTITPPPTTTPLVTPDPVTVSLTSDGITESSKYISFPGLFTALQLSLLCTIESDCSEMYPCDQLLILKFRFLELS